MRDNVTQDNAWVELLWVGYCYCQETVKTLKYFQASTSRHYILLYIKSNLVVF